MAGSASDCRAVWVSAEQLQAEHGDYVQLGEDRSVRVIDQLAQQRQELAELPHDCPNELFDEPYRWAYYPWRRCVVKVLGPKGFKRLRSDRNRNKITAAEQRAMADKTIAVVGLSVGHAVAHALAQEGLCGKLRLLDFDQLSLSNLNRIPATVADIALPKTVVLARRIAEIDPYCEVELVGAGLSSDNLDEALRGVDLIVDECDSIDMKFALRFFAKRARLPVLMQTSDAGVLDVERFDLEPQRALFHGLVEIDNPAQLSGLSSAEKVPLVMAILQADKITPRLAASMVEIDERLSTWPQLAGDIAFGAGMVAAAARRWALGQSLPSGRLRLDMDRELDAIATPVAARLESEPVERVEPADAREALLAAACRAPSGGNVQPWRFAADANDFAIYLDPERSSLMDIRYRGSLLALGAAACNVQVKAAAQGGGAAIEALAETLNPGQRAGREPVVRLALGGGADRSLISLEPLIDRRACARLRGASGAIDDAWRARVLKRAEEQGCQAVFLQGEQLREAAAIWAEADRIRFLTPQLHREMMSELSFAGDDVRRGIDVRTLELSEKDQAALQIARRPDAMSELAGWGGGKRLGEASAKLIGDADAMVVLTCAGYRDADYVRAGQLLQRLWLEATRDRVGLHPMSPLFLYATAPSDLVGRVSPGDAARMWSLRVAFAQLCGFAAEQPIALTMRATTEVRFTVRSEREHWHDRLYRAAGAPAPSASLETA